MTELDLKNSLLGRMVYLMGREKLTEVRLNLASAIDTATLGGMTASAAHLREELRILDEIANHFCWR